jgi:hypothetical protein
MFNSKEFGLVVRLLLVIVLWLVFTGFVLPAILKIASSILLVLALVGTALAAYFTIKYLTHLYNQNKVVCQ